MGIFSKPAPATAVFDPVAFKAVLLKVVKAYSNNRSTVKRSIWVTILATVAIRIHSMATAKPKKEVKKTGLTKGDGKAAKVAVRNYSFSFFFFLDENKWRKERKVKEKNKEGNERQEIPVAIIQLYNLEIPST